MYHGERFNSFTHLAGTALAIAGSALLITRASEQGDPWKIFAFTTFGVGLVLLYAASTLYHSFRGPSKALLRKLDHVAIYLLITATYAPFLLVSLRGPFGWTLFAVVWAMALYGIVQAWRRNDGSDPSPVPYMAMGWLGVTAFVPLVDKLGPQGLAWLAAGGALYTAGVLFYVNDRRWRHAHGIWHLFVMGGSASHFIAVFNFVS
ncbi:MAG: hemolysin III family protein [Burkholderiaceae bacterium]